MVNNVKARIICPCDRLFDTRTVNSNSGTIKRGQFTCSVCKRKGEFAISGGYATTNYK